MYLLTFITAALVQAKLNNFRPSIYLTTSAALTPAADWLKLFRWWSAAYLCGRSLR
ncbi:MAG: hypothetical protein ACTS4X_01515 [Candidatus Hodgkinia cicadicola]